MNPPKNSVIWTLDKGSAVTFYPRKSGLLRVREGQDLPVRAGQRLVLESWPLAGASRISLVWEPLASKALASVLYPHNFFQAAPRCCK